MRTLSFHIALYVLFIVCFSIHATAQKKSKVTAPPAVSSPKSEIISCDILENGDSINRVDRSGKKQGPWFTFQKALRGEEGYSDYGDYVDDRKVGKWCRFSLTGKPVSVENYKSGKLNGEAKYYEDGRLICVGNYYALRDVNSIDTFLVEDPGTGKIYPVYIKSTVGSVRHGLWTYYDLETGQPYRTTEYQADKIIFDKTILTPKDSAFIQRQALKYKTSDEKNESVWMKNKKSKAQEYIGLPTLQHYKKPGK